MHTYIHTYIASVSELLCLTPILVSEDFEGSSVATVCLPWERHCFKDGSYEASDINRLYTERKRGGKGLLDLEDMYENRIIGLKEHLTEEAQKHSTLKIVEEPEKKGIIRPGQEFEERIRNVQGDAKIKDSIKKRTRALVLRNRSISLWYHRCNKCTESTKHQLQ